MLDTDAILHRCICPRNALLYQPDRSCGSRAGINFTKELLMLMESRLEALLMGLDYRRDLWFTLYDYCSELIHCRHLALRCAVDPTTQVTLE